MYKRGGEPKPSKQKESPKTRITESEKKVNQHGCP